MRQPPHVPAHKPTHPKYYLLAAGVGCLFTVTASTAAFYGNYSPSGSLIAIISMCGALLGALAWGMIIYADGGHKRNESASR